MNQRTLMGRIKALTHRIVEYQGKFDLPKGHKDRYETYGGAQVLQRMRSERSAAQASLDPIRLIATGVSCRDCRHFADVEEPLCWRFGFGNPTKEARANGSDCGPNAELFAHG